MKNSIKTIKNSEKSTAKSEINLAAFHEWPSLDGSSASSEFKKPETKAETPQR